MIFTGKHRVVQLHPTLRCNLRCLHCYSESGPEQTTALPLDVASAAVRDAAEWDYHVLAFSGGEPLLYEGLFSLLDAARVAGLRTTITTNGTVLTPWRLAALEDRVDLLTISLDGVPESHDRIRDSKGAFARMERSLPAVRDSGIRFGFIFTLTQQNVHELDWVARFAADQGAKLLQIHPLELAGRARARMAPEHPDPIELGFGFAEWLRLRAQYGDRMRVHLDVATRRGFGALMERDGGRGSPSTLSAAVSPLVIEADGTVVPLTYGFPREHSIGNLHEAPLSTLGRRWLDQRYERYREMISRLDDEEMWPKRLPVLNPYEAAISLAEREGSQSSFTRSN